MKALDQPFTKIINGTMQFVIPVFQRDYSWSEVQCEQLWKDIIQIAGSESERGHFLGSVVYIATGDTSAGFTRWLLIDGQQRVTTITLLLTALRDHIYETGWQGDEDGPTSKRIDAYFLKNLQEEGAREHKLVLRGHDQGTLRALLDSADFPDDTSDKIRENYEYFHEQVQNVDPSIVYRGIGRLIVVDVTLDRGTDDPQLIFESLNSTGVDLSQSDLIRNFVLMGLPETDQTKLYETYWRKIEGLFRSAENVFDTFVRDYLALNMRTSKQGKSNEIYRTFRENFVRLKKDAGGLEDLLKDMLTNARYYAAYAIDSSNFPNLQSEFSRLRKLTEAPTILIVRLFQIFHDTDEFDVHQFKSVLALVESYIFRRAICRLTGKNYWNIFSNIAYRINEDAPLESLSVYFARQTDRQRFPSNDEFRVALETGDMYGTRMCTYLLERLENHGSKEQTDTRKYTVEHVLPQNEKLSKAWRTMLGEDWKKTREVHLHRLGNLTLTGYNSTYSDKPFEQKKTVTGGFEESSVRLNKDIREQTKWTHVEISRRGKRLANRSLKIWPPLEVDDEAIRFAMETDLRERESRQDLSRVVMSSKANELFLLLRPKIKELKHDLIELAEGHSVSYHAPGFFVEVLPRKKRLVLVFPMDFNEVDDPEGVVRDETNRTFFANAAYEGGISVRINEVDDIDLALPVIKQAIALANS